MRMSSESKWLSSNGRVASNEGQLTVPAVARTLHLIPHRRKESNHAARTRRTMWHLRPLRRAPRPRTTAHPDPHLARGPEDLVEECGHPRHASLHLMVTPISGCDGFKPAVSNEVH